MNLSFENQPIYASVIFVVNSYHSIHILCLFKWNQMKWWKWKSITIMISQLDEMECQIYVHKDLFEIHMKAY